MLHQCICGKPLGGFNLYRCHYCGGVFCPDHALPEKHGCTGTFDTVENRVKLEPDRVMSDGGVRAVNAIIATSIPEDTERMPAYAIGIDEPNLFNLLFCPRCGTRYKTPLEVGEYCKGDCGCMVSNVGGRLHWWSLPR